MIMAAKSLDPSDLTAKPNMVVLHEVNPDIVEAISRQIQLIHAEFNGFSSSGLCNDMTNVDVAIHMDEAVERCGYKCPDGSVYFDFLLALNNYLETRHIKSFYM